MDLHRLGISRIERKSSTKRNFTTVTIGSAQGPQPASRNRPMQASPFSELLRPPRASARLEVTSPHYHRRQPVKCPHRAPSMTYYPIYHCQPIPAVILKISPRDVIFGTSLAPSDDGQTEQSHKCRGVLTCPAVASSETRKETPSVGLVARI